MFLCMNVSIFNTLIFTFFQVGAEKELNGSMYMEEGNGMNITSLYHGAWPLTPNKKGLWSWLKCVYRKQGNIRPHFIFTPFSLVVSEWIWDWANSNVSNCLSINTVVSGRIHDGAKLLASKGRMKITRSEITLTFEWNFRNKPKLLYLLFQRIKILGLPSWISRGYLKSFTIEHNENLLKIYQIFTFFFSLCL